ncbi:hypothetical protein ABG768_018677 [Culter alburnus]|uniref:Uncharacterized protein n=1 Tax=Culter alburnus TaxID=194366 RepID=A0AAW2AVC4_CULAL
MGEWDIATKVPGAPNFDIQKAPGSRAQGKKLHCRKVSRFGALSQGPLGSRNLKGPRPFVSARGPSVNLMGNRANNGSVGRGRGLEVVSGSPDCLTTIVGNRANNGFVGH